MLGDSITSSVVQRALDGVWQRQKAISANIANYETPRGASAHRPENLLDRGFERKPASVDCGLERERSPFQPKISPPAR